LPATLTVTVTNNPPSVSAAASPTVLLAGQSTSFASTASDPDGDALTYSWDFGDGATATTANPSHTYISAGTYTATVTVTDIANATATSSVVIHVYTNADRPTALFVSNVLNGFVGEAVGFDATLSTDPENNIVSYSWDFGDGSPLGSGQAIARKYTAVGTYTVTLTITDARGLTDTTSLSMVILPADELGQLNTFLSYKVSWNRKTTNADSLSLDALVNVGGAKLTATTPLSLGIVGQTFSGTSGKTLQLLKAPSGQLVKWQVKAGKRGSPSGTVQLKATITHASVGLAFNQAGIVGTKSANGKIPLNLKVGGLTLSSSITSSFRFGNGGVKASGGGQGPN